MEKRERRFYMVPEIRTVDGDSPTIAGYAAVFNKPTEIHPKLREQVASGAFQDSIQSDDVRALWSHNPDMPLGRTQNNTLRLFEDDIGLGFQLELPDTQIGRDAFTSIKRGDVTGMSFGFSVVADKWERGQGAEPHMRTLEKVKLFEVSPVAFPAYEATKVSARDAESLVKEHEMQWMYDDKEGVVSDAQRVRALLARMERENAIQPFTLVH